MKIWKNHGNVVARHLFKRYHFLPVMLKLNFELFLSLAAVDYALERPRRVRLWTDFPAIAWFESFCMVEGSLLARSVNGSKGLFIVRDMSDSCPCKTCKSIKIEWSPKNLFSVHMSLSLPSCYTRMCLFDTIYCLEGILQLFYFDITKSAIVRLHGEHTLL